LKERFIETVAVQRGRFCREGHGLAVDGVRASRKWSNGAMVTAGEGLTVKLVTAKSIFAIVSDKWESISAMHMHLLMMLLCLYPNMLLLRQLGPVTVARRGPLSRMLIHVHIMCAVLVMRDVMLIKLLEERASGGKMGRWG